MFKELAYLTALRCVDAAARHQSYTKAAAELHVTQAAVSQQIRLLESVLGAKLFTRTGHRMLPTAKGRILATHLDRAFKVMADGLKQIKTEPLEGVLNITTTQSFATLFLMARLWDFHRLHPEIEVKIFVSSENEDLIHGEMDVAIRFGFSEWSGLAQTVLFEDGLVPLCSPNLTHHVDLTDPHNIRQCALVDPDQAPGRDWMTWLAKAGLEIPRSQLKFLHVSNLDIAFSAVLAGHGMVLGSPILAERLLQSGSLVQPFQVRLERGIRYNLLHDPNTARLTRIQAFKDWIIQQFPSRTLKDQQTE
ncbi:MAG: LysR family transcriptional regulator [Acidobacteria bacterium]|nr:LysR family transcriptional regulator [Acidobacteriota bacterium]